MPQAAARLAAEHDLVTLAQGATARGRGAAGGRRRQGARAGGAGGPAGGAPARPRAARDARARLACDLCRSGAPAHRLCRAHAGRRAARRDRGADRPHRPRRISRADPGRHSDQPGRDRAPGRSRPVRRRGRRAHDAGRRGADRHRQHRGASRAAGRADPRKPRRDGRRLRPRRDAGIDPRGDAQVRRQRGDRARAGLAPHQQLHPARDHRADGRARRVRPHHPRGVRRHGARQGIDVRRLRGAVARLYRRRLARHPLGDRRRADPRRRHRGAEAASGCRRSPPARCCRPRCSPSRTPAPTSPR